MRKVFRIWKFAERCLSFNTKEDNQNLIKSLKSSWPFEMEGKTIEEIGKLCYMTCSEWMVEEE